MWDRIVEAAANTGLWALLFVTLFFIELKDSKSREERYQQTIDSLAERLSIVCDIKDDVTEIKNKIG